MLQRVTRDKLCYLVGATTLLTPLLCFTKPLAAVKLNFNLNCLIMDGYSTQIARIRVHVMMRACNNGRPATFGVRPS
jgi:hypothetical protein